MQGNHLHSHLQTSEPLLVREGEGGADGLRQHSKGPAGVGGVRFGTADSQLNGCITHYCSDVVILCLLLQGSGG